MKTLLLIVAIALTSAVGAPRVSAQSAMFVYSGVPVAAVLPGTSFTVQLSLQVLTGGAMDNFIGLSYWMAQSSPVGGPFPFQITNRNITGSIFTDLNSVLVYPQTLDPINRNPNGTQTSTDLGALLVISIPAQPSGTYYMASLTFQVIAGAAPGTYTLGNTTNTTPGVADRISMWFDWQGDTAPISASPFTITVVPEPSFFALMIVGAVGAGLAIYRRRRKDQALKS